MANSQYKQPTAHLPKSGFDMQQTFGFSSSTGMLLPVYSDFLNAGEKVYFSASMFSRCNNLLTAALADVDVHIDWFFVPMSMLFTLFPSLRYRTDDRISSFYDDRGKDSLPRFNMSAFCSCIRGNSQVLINSLERANQSISGLHFEKALKSQFRLLDMLHYNPFSVYWRMQNGELLDDWEKKLVESPNVFPYRLLAYQCIYNKHYRNEDFEIMDINSFNVDKRGYAAGISIVNPNASDLNILQLRYRDRYKDYFTSLKPSPIMSGVSMLGNASESLSRFNDWLSSTKRQYGHYDSGSFAGPTNEDGYDQSVVTGGQYGTNFGGSALTGGSALRDNDILTVSNIRGLFAVDKLLRNVGRAHKDYDSQILAHFGYNVPKDIMHQLSFLGSDVATMHIGEVISTADTASADGQSGLSLGAVGGKGYIALQGRKRTFEAPCDGIFMAIYSAVPHLRYYGGFDKQNAVSDMSDFFTPEYDRLGMQPIFAYEQSAAFFSDDPDWGETNPYFPGWQFRFNQWKQKYDRVSAAFMTAPNVGEQQNDNMYQHWVIANRPFSTPAFDTTDVFPYMSGFHDLKTSPHDLDNLLIMPYQDSITEVMLKKPWLMFATDPLWNDFRANVKKVSTMSPTGEPVNQ